MLSLLLIPIPIAEPARAQSEVLRLERASRELTAEELHKLSGLLEQRVRLAEALVAYAIAIAGRPRVN
jgi:ABC-type Mn2+/Zn2+ transport system ATPase subunit